MRLRLGCVVQENRTSPVNSGRVLAEKAIKLKSLAISAILKLLHHLIEVETARLLPWRVLLIGG
jgi:hypothetical protein